jgi:hypothetical protein
MLFALNSEGNGHFCPYQREVTALCMEGEIFYPQRKIIPIKTYYFEIKLGMCKMVSFYI